jgi:hypothetical protein
MLAEDAAPSTAEHRPLVREARGEDRARITRLTIEGMDWSPIMELGEGFVSLMIEHGIRSRHSFCHVAELDGRVEGFMLCLFDARRWYREFLWKRAWRAAFLLLPKVFVPRHRKAIWRGATYFPEASDEDPEAEVLIAAVNEELKRSGIGTALFRSTMLQYKERGVKRVKFGDIDVRNQASTALFGSKAVLHRSFPVYGGNLVNVYHYEIPDELEG